MGRLVLDEDQEPVYAMQLSGVHINKFVKVGTAAKLRLRAVYHMKSGEVRIWGNTRAGERWNYGITDRRQNYDAVVTFYKEEETRAKH